MSMSVYSSCYENSVWQKPGLVLAFSTDAGLLNPQDGRTRLILLDLGEGCLETYLPGGPKHYTPAANSRRYRAISSIDNEICLFPAATNNDTCCQIAELMVRQRDH